MSRASAEPAVVQTSLQFRGAAPPGPAAIPGGFVLSPARSFFFAQMCVSQLAVIDGALVSLGGAE